MALLSSWISIYHPPQSLLLQLYHFHLEYTHNSLLAHRRLSSETQDRLFIRGDEMAWGEQTFLEATQRPASRPL